MFSGLRATQEDKILGGHHAVYVSPNNRSAGLYLRQMFSKT